METIVTAVSVMRDFMDTTVKKVRTEQLQKTDRGMKNRKLGSKGKFML